MIEQRPSQYFQEAIISGSQSERPFVHIDHPEELVVETRGLYFAITPTEAGFAISSISSAIETRNMSKGRHAAPMTEERVQFGDRIITVLPWARGERSDPFAIIDDTTTFAPIRVLVSAGDRETEKREAFYVMRNNNGVVVTPAGDHTIRVFKGYDMAVTSNAFGVYRSAA